MIITHMGGSGLLIILGALTLSFMRRVDTSIICRAEVWAVSRASLSFSVYVDLMRALFGLTVLTISLSVFFFSCYYVDGLKGYSRFHAILLVFIASMLLLIFSPNIFRLILG